MKENFKKANLGGGIAIKMDDSKGVWKADKREIIRAIISICEEYVAEGYVLTLRQLYYQLVARDIIPNHDKVYKKISSLKDEAVYGGLVDWEVFEDRGRVPHTPYFEDSIEGALERTMDYYRLDRQRNQTDHIEVWTEKDAISSILKNVTNRYGVTISVNKGYTSSTAIYGAYKRFSEVINKGGKVKILYFGDHDPSGLDMIRDIRERLLFMFTNGEQLGDVWQSIEAWWSLNGYTYYELEDVGEWENIEDSVEWNKRYEASRIKQYFKENDIFEVMQVGLTMEQIREYNPPHNPAKITDPRAGEYIRKYGSVSWEVDALKPKVMEAIVRGAIEEVIDMNAYREVVKQERAEKEQIKEIIKGLSNGN